MMSSSDLLTPYIAQKTVYVGGFSLDTRPENLQAAFGPFGDIVDIQLPPDPAKRELLCRRYASRHAHLPRSAPESSHRGFAFVSFSQGVAALDAIDNMHRNVLPGPSNVGRPLKVNMAKPPKGAKLGGSNRASECRRQWTASRTASYGCSSLRGALLCFVTRPERALELLWRLSSIRPRQRKRCILLLRCSKQTEILLRPHSKNTQYRHVAWQRTAG